VAAFALAAPAARAVPLHLHVAGSVAPFLDPDGAVVALGIGVGSPVALDLFYDPEAAGSYFTGYWNSETAYYPLPSASFSLTLSVGPASFSSASGDGGLDEGVVSTYHTVGLSDPFQDYQISSRLGTGAGCAPACVDLSLVFRDDVAPFDLYAGKSILQVPDLSATTTSWGGIEGWYTGFGAVQVGFVLESFSLEVVPEPGTGLLLAVGLAALARRAQAAS